jgi:hypothetical protein
MPLFNVQQLENLKQKFGGQSDGLPGSPSKKVADFNNEPEIESVDKRVVPVKRTDGLVIQRVKKEKKNV